MKSMNERARLLVRAVAIASVFALGAIGVSAQETTSETVRHGASQYDTTVKNAQVVYVDGNDLVLRVEGGRIEHLVVPDTDRFTINGQDVTVHELTPGTKLTQTITTTTVPHYVTNVRTLTGRVFHVSPPHSVILTLPQGGNRRFTVPNDTKFTIGGQEKSIFDLRKGMTVEATIITDETRNVMQVSKSTVGQAPSPVTPTQVGVLLILRPSASNSASSGRGQVASELPKTGSPLPLLGLLGVICIAASFGCGAIRKFIMS